MYMSSAWSEQYPYHPRFISKQVIDWLTKKLMIMDKYVCEVCDWVYDPEVGDPEGGIAPGTAFEDIPDDWVCPLCGVGKDQFAVVKD